MSRPELNEDEGVFLRVTEDRVLVREFHGSSSDQQSSYLLCDAGPPVTVSKPRPWNSVNQALRTVLLPQGYPDSVSRDYLEYQVWDSIQAFCSSINGTLATHAVMKGVGVGDETATPLAATITWMLRDGAGMLGQIFFVLFKSAALDSESKKWRLRADVLNDGMFFLQLLAPTPFFEDYFLPITCVSAVCRSVVGVAGGATRAAVMQHQTRRNNMADLSAKDETQETAVNLVALVVNLLLIPLVVSNPGTLWTLFVILSGFHIYTNYRAVKCIVMETFNPPRLRFVTEHFLRTGYVPTVRQTNNAEPVFFGFAWPLRIRLGCSIASLQLTKKSFKLLSATGKPFLLHLDLNSREILIVLNRRSQVLDQLSACWLAHILVICFCAIRQNPNFAYSELCNVVKALEAGDSESAVDGVQVFGQRTFQEFVKQSREMGWKLEGTSMGGDDWRADW